MQIKILLFGIVADLIGKSSVEIDLKEHSTIAGFKQQLIVLYPQLKHYATFAVAVNEAYALDNTKIQEKDVIAIIPPVSGG
jgi:molybdopterin converting factor subunit 1